MAIAKNPARSLATDNTLKSTVPQEIELCMQFAVVKLTAAVNIQSCHGMYCERQMVIIYKKNSLHSKTDMESEVEFYL